MVKTLQKGGKKTWIAISFSLVAVLIAIVVLWPDDHFDRLKRDCEAARSARQWDKLDQLSSEWLEIDQTNGFAWLYQATAAEQKGDHERAVECLSMLDDDHPKCLQALAQRVNLLEVQLNRPLDAVETCHRILKIDSHNADAHQHLVYFYAVSLQREAMIAQIRRSIRDECELPETYVYLVSANSLNRLNGLETIARWIRSHPENEHFQVALADYTANQFTKKSAAGVMTVMDGDEAAINECRRQFPQNLEVQSYFARKAIEDGDTVRLAEILDDVPNDVSDSRFWSYRGWLLATTGSLEDARESYEQAIRLHPFDWQARHELAGVLRRLGKTVAAATNAALALTGKEFELELGSLADASQLPLNRFQQLATYADDCGDSFIASAMRRRLLGQNRNGTQTMMSDPTRQTSNNRMKPVTALLEKRPQNLNLDPTIVPTLREVQAAAGIDFVYDTGAIGKKLMVESIGGGAGWLDFDNDGHPDIYLVQGGNPLATSSQDQPSNQLYRNQGDSTFVEVSQAAAVDGRGYGQGITVGDFDNDGFDDIYVTNVGRNVLFQNNGDGTFREMTDYAGVGDNYWGTSAAWGDLDLDGDLDIFLCNYVKYDVLKPVDCPRPDGKPGVCPPVYVEPRRNQCFENLGNGRFRPVAREWGLRGDGSKSLGVVIADFDGDHRPDVFVANDTTANFFFRNRGDGRFEEAATLLGCAMSETGVLQASMGIGFGDFDRNGFPDLYLTHFTRDSNTMYANLGPNGFHDTTRSSGLHQPTFPFLGFGTVMTDFNHDGRDDLFVTNGHIDDWRNEGQLWRMPPQLFTYDGRNWLDCRQQAGPFFEKKLIGRAVAMADYDGDGDRDLVIVHQNSPTVLLQNDSVGGHWLSLRFVGLASNRRGIGVQVTLQQGSTQLVQQLPGGTSYCASHEPALDFGLGESDQPCSLIIHWPSGRTQERKGVAPNQKLILIEPNE